MVTGLGMATIQLMPLMITNLGIMIPRQEIGIDFPIMRRFTLW